METQKLTPTQAHTYMRSARAHTYTHNTHTHTLVVRLVKAEMVTKTISNRGGHFVIGPVLFPAVSA